LLFVPFCAQFFALFLKIHYKKSNTSHILYILSINFKGKRWTVPTVWFSKFWSQITVLIILHLVKKWLRVPMSSSFRKSLPSLIFFCIYNIYSYNIVEPYLAINILYCLLVPSTASIISFSDLDLKNHLMAYPSPKSAINRSIPAVS